MITDVKTRIAVISNIVLEPFVNQTIKDGFKALHKNADIDYIPFSDIFSKESADCIKNEDYIIVLPNYKELDEDKIYGQTNTNNTVSTSGPDDIFIILKKLYDHLKSVSDAHIIWFGLEDCEVPLYYCFGTIPSSDYRVELINYQMFNHISSNDTFCDMKALVARCGISFAYDSKSKYRWNSPYSKQLQILIGQEIIKQIKICTGINKKCLILDCDNVLWGGILSEDGIAGISVSNEGSGRFFRDFQHFILMLYNKGVILALCSKNDEEDVRNVFRTHSGMVLKEENIAYFSVNWENKADNISEICSYLNIDYNSVVFIDDTIQEIQAVNTFLPDVHTILFDKSTVYSELSVFNLNNKTTAEEVYYRNETYRTNKARQIIKETCFSLDEYVNLLEQKVDIENAQPSDIKRVSELSLRANKYTNGIRYTCDQLINRTNSPDYKLVVVKLKDKFSDMGLVGAIGFSGDELDLFVLSCRALGRNVENIMSDTVKKHGIKSYKFDSTGKNSVVYEELNSLICEK